MPDIKGIIGFGIVGIVVAWATLELLRRSLFLLTKKGTGALVFFGLALVRIVIFAGGLVGAVLMGPWPLAAYLVCFVVTRTIIVSMARGPAAPEPTDTEETSEPEKEKDDAE